MTTNSTPLASNLVPRRGDVWLVEFDPVKGDEIRKSRPAIVISSDAFTPLKTRLVVPLTSWQEKFTNSDWMVKIIADGNNGLERDSAADALQLRCVSYQRCILKLGEVSALILDEIAAAIAIVIEYK
jgi:mRNA interferase MazF